MEKGTSEMNAEIQSVAIVGGGPAGSALATFLVRAGKKVALFADDRRPEIMIGESLIPGVIPVLDALGVEEKVSRIGMYKPGATIYFTPDFEETFFFNVLDEPLNQYAFNVPRDKFDTILLENAIEAGVKHFPFRAEVSADRERDTVALSEDTLKRTQGFFTNQPDLIIDSTGRVRVFASLFDIKADVGSRKDVALFAHRDTAKIVRRGNIHVSVLEDGWSWRIPLPGKVSVGVVAPAEYFEQYGSDPVEQYDAIFAKDPLLAPTVAGSKRITGVQKYGNYQLCSERMHGANWAMVGDAAGFVDPMFSSGLCVSLNGAQDLAKAICQGTRSAFAEYERKNRDHLRAWKVIVESFYKKEFYNIVRARKDGLKADPSSRDLQSSYVYISGILAGVETQKPELIQAYSRLVRQVTLVKELEAA